MAKTIEEIKEIINENNVVPASLFNNKRIAAAQAEAGINYLREGDKISALHAAREAYAAMGRFVLKVEELQ